jgi:plastocyanin
MEGDSIMAATLVARPAARRRPTPDPLVALTVAATLAIAALYAYYVVAIFPRPNWPYMPIVAAPLLCAALAATGRPWTPLLAPAMALIVLASPVRGDIPYNLARPGETRYFVYTLVLLAALGVAVTVGIAATLRQRGRGGPLRATVAAVVIGGLLLGATIGGLLRATSGERDTAAGFTDAELAAMPTFAMGDLYFAPSLIEVRAGQTVAIRFTNDGLLPHAFDFDGDRVHLRVPPGRSGVAVFTPSVPGTYTFYCGVGDHRAEGMVGTLIVRP